MRRLVSVTVLLLVTSACGGSQDQAATADLAKAGEIAAKEIASGKALSSAVIPFEKLIPFLPEIPGWTKQEPKGETLKVGVTLSNAKVSYEKPDSSELEIEISDSSMTAAMLAPYAAILKGNHSETTAEGYSKTTTINGFPASETWQHDTKWGEFKIIVAERFIVSVKGNAVPDVETVRKAAEAMDLKGLAALR